MALPKLETNRATESRKFWLSTCSMPRFGTYSLLAMEEGESDFNPEAHGDKHHGEATAFSIFQWHIDRVQAMLAGCHIDVRTADHTHALKAAYYELRHSEHRSWDLLLTARSIEEAVGIGVRHFERPGNPASDIVKRTAFAYYWQNFFEPKAKPPLSMVDR